MGIKIESITPFEKREVRFLHTGDFFVDKDNLYCMIEGCTGEESYNKLNDNVTKLCFNLNTLSKEYLNNNIEVYMCKSVEIYYSLLEGGVKS